MILERPKTRFDAAISIAFDQDAIPEGSASKAPELFHSWARKSERISNWLTRKRLGQLAANVSVMPALFGVIILFSGLPSSMTSSNEPAESFTLRPTAFIAEEIFLPRSLLAKVNDEDLIHTLSGKNEYVINKYLDVNGLRDAWFLVRYRGVDSEGSTWRGRDANFECKRYYIHSSFMEDPRDWLSNLDVLSGVLSRTAGQGPGSIADPGQAKHTIMKILHFDTAKVIPIPDDATGLKYINKTDVDSWRGRAAREVR